MAMKLLHLFKERMKNIKSFLNIDSTLHNIKIYHAYTLWYAFLHVSVDMFDFSFAL